MRIVVQTSNSPEIGLAVSASLAGSRRYLADNGILYPLALGETDHSRLQLFAMNGDPGAFVQLDAISDAQSLNNLRAHITGEIAAEIRAARPRLLVIGLPLAAAINDPNMVTRIFQVLSEFTDDLHALLQFAPVSKASADHRHLQILRGAIEPQDLPSKDEIVTIWQNTFGISEVVTQNVEHFDDALLGFGKVCDVSLQSPEKHLELHPNIRNEPRLIEVNKAILEYEGISRYLINRIHFEALGKPDFPVENLISNFQKELRQDRKSRRVRRRVQNRINSALTAQPSEGLTKGGAQFLDDAGKAQVEAVRSGQFRPRNSGVVNFNESIIPAPLNPAPSIPSTKTLVVACIKNEAPYILEWIAHHQGIGVDDFLIYSNDCSDGSDKILDRLDEMGIIHHENNDEWKGKSPQQAALNKALKHKAYRKADWIAHIDIDEFINLRWGETGTLPELYAMMGDATNLAMTWRMFGHNDIHDFADEPVIKQFTGAVPAFCPKPHTAWGFKTLLRNDGHYGKLSCHRPNKLVDGQEDHVNWLNGSLMPMGENVKTQGWRSSIANVGFNAVQLNHYALRSADSFLVKRQRGRALHVDRSIGLNYWVRMDWNLHREMSIQRFLPRTMAGIDALKSDPKLLDLHNKGVDWHRAKAHELKQTTEFQDLYNQVTNINLTDDERVAATLAADMET